MECPICRDPLVDPRALPCGHSYCALPKLCLKSLQIDPGVLKCANCRQEHRISISRLKPLYGIRDVLKKEVEQRQINQELTQKLENIQERGHQKLLLTLPKCDNTDCSTFVTFWCKKCFIAVCEHCFEANHDSHSMLLFETFLQRQVRHKLGTKCLRKQLDDLRKKGYCMKKKLKILIILLKSCKVESGPKKMKFSFHF